MLKRVLWLLAAVSLPVWGLFAGMMSMLDTAAAASAFPVVINEWSQGNGGSKEWVELLVVSETVDLRGWDLGDSTAGDLTFSEDSLWEAVPAGTLIVIYNASDRDDGLPVDDEDLVDRVLIVPHNHPALFSGGWPSFANGTDSDNPHLRDGNDLTVHDFSVNPGGDLHPEGNEAVAYTAGTADEVGSTAAWQMTPADQATPGQGNGAVNIDWIESLRSDEALEPNLSVEKIGEPSGEAGQPLVYTITVQNSGRLTATAVVVTDHLPVGLTYLEDNHTGTPSVTGQEVVWEVGELVPEAMVSFQMTVSVGYDRIGRITNTVSVSTAVTETLLGNNMDTAVTYIQTADEATVLIEAVLYHGQAKNNSQGDESVAVRNVSAVPADLSGWQINDGGTSFAVLPDGVILPAGEAIWLAADAEAFRQQFGFWPDYAIEATGTAQALTGRWPGYADSGDGVILYDETLSVMDVLIYEDGDTSIIGWQGVAVEPYKLHSGTAVRGQILYRKAQWGSGLPVADTDTAADWAQDPADWYAGRKVRYPGWGVAQYQVPAVFTTTAAMTVAIAPDNAYETLVETIGRAQQTIDIELHTFAHVGLADALIAAVQRGVRVTVLLEGGPPGGIDDQQRYVCQQLEAAGGQCWYMINDDSMDVYDRYTYLHAKFGVIDGRIAFVSSENFSPNSLPSDNKLDGTWGRRGVVLVTDAPELVSYLQVLFAADFNPAVHHDLRRYEASDPKYGAPPIDFAPVLETGGVTYTVRYTEPIVFDGLFPFEVIQSPENSLVTAEGMLGLLNQAGAGDTILVQQLSERPYWGDSPETDPNLRVQAYVDAARRGAAVWVLLDSYFDAPYDPLSNSATCFYLNELALAESLRLRCVVGNPAGLGIHNKMILAEIGGQGVVHIGSINGTEQSHKGNRELALQITSNELYALLSEMFFADWPHRVMIPVMMHETLEIANYILISEILYDPTGLDGSEFIELVNPLSHPVDISGYALGDAVNREDFADVRRFPAGTELAAQQVVVVAQQAAAFEDQFGFKPDFEILETDAAVLNLEDDLTWGDTATFLQLGNSGDVVILRNPSDEVVDAIAYGEVVYDEALICPLTETGHSLRRNPYRVDRDSCAADFEAWPIPDPGRLPAN